MHVMLNLHNKNNQYRNFMLLSSTFKRASPQIFEYTSIIFHLGFYLKIYFLKSW